MSVSPAGDLAHDGSGGDEDRAADADGCGEGGEGFPDERSAFADSEAGGVAGSCCEAGGDADGDAGDQEDDAEDGEGELADGRLGGHGAIVARRFRIADPADIRPVCWRGDEVEALVAAHQHLGVRHPVIAIVERTGSGSFRVRRLSADGGDSGWGRWVAGVFVDRSVAA